MPGSTYRLQLHAGFGFDAAREQVAYLASLGVTHLYLSPILQAAPGSVHGYDVVDHSRVSRDLGGIEGLAALAETAHAHGLGIVVDVVPNHMTLSQPLHLNAQLWDVLRNGRASAYAHWFDVDWDHLDGRLGLPVLGDLVEELIEAGELTLDRHDGEPVVRYHEQVFPVAPGTESDDVSDVLDAQHYELDSWLNKAYVLNYRRFFDVDDLVAVRVELPDVFEATHGVLVDLHRRGVIDGFRIDHVDGLADPEGYLELLRAATGGAWVVVEKILEGDERLPATWATAGSTGYDAVKAIAQSLVPDVGEALTSRWRDLGGDPDLATVEVAAKREVVQRLFAPEVDRLVRVTLAATGADGRDEEHERLGAELTELLVHVDAYRAYVRPGHDVAPDSIDRIHRLCERASRARPDMAEAFVALRRLLLDSHPASEAGAELVVRFGQTCGPVMAKGVEDTTFYRWHRLIALNEVGGDPSLLDRPDADALHRWASRQAADHPYAMTTLSTHDTKRSDDVRSRLLALAEDLDGWDAAWATVRALAQRHHVDLPTAYLLMQTLLGAWPLEEERLVGYLRKAVREAKQHTTWTEVDDEYEARVFELCRQCLGPDVATDVERVLAAGSEQIRATTLATTLIQLTLPGVPDTYQGTELVELSLVDPDNRRPVDYAGRVARLQRLDAGAAPVDLSEEKLLVTSRALRLRRERPEVFAGSYQPVVSASPHLLGFVRGGDVATLVTRWPGALESWGGVSVDLPGSWTDVLTGATYRNRLSCAELF
ncbi:MAG: malto-oligosyltrehalose synthase, partial [Actinomycetota bacterium]|nr:malto-oligosyltrehalose synthase [Actinomycetota bacterium]